ncbi:MAG TPA: aldehyde dehydrogenase family protein, partial [Chromobacteriaceae bacterium]|nr:aldehyde dehydrogenase family protein [Chromobacteriaceae bacterium]
DISRAAASIVAGKLLNAGQTCVAPDYVLVPENQIDALTQALRAAASRAYPTLAENPDYTAIINARHRGRLQAWLQDAVAAGATAIEINPAQENLAATGKMALTLVLGCPDSATLLQEEIFGPILPLVTYREFDDALAYVNARPRPLALYLFDTQPARIRQTLTETISGGVAINDTLLQVAQDDLPFGGVGPSGMGHYHAYEGFLTFSKLKPVFEQSRLSGVWLTRPPYGARVAWMLKWMLGR